MSEFGGSRETIDEARDLEYPTHDLGEAARQLGVLDDLDVLAYYQHCLESVFEDRTAYEQGLVPMVHAFDLSRVDGIDDRDLHGLSLLLADVHHRSGRYDFCLHELMIARRRLMNEGALDGELFAYMTAAIYDVAPQTSPPLEAPVITSAILANKNLPE